MQLFIVLLFLAIKQYTNKVMHRLGGFEIKHPAIVDPPLQETSIY